MAGITENTRVPFGREKNKRLRDCSDAFLRWMVERLLNTDHHMYGYLAKQILEKREAEGQAVATEAELEQQADEFLRAAGFAELCPRRTRRA